MRPSTYLAVFLIIFGFVTSGINSLGMFDTILPTTAGCEIDQSSVVETTEGIVNAPLTEFSTLAVMLSLGRTVFFGLISALTVLPLLVGELGIPVPIAMMIQGPIWIIYILDRMAWVSGRES